MMNDHIFFLWHGNFLDRYSYYSEVICLNDANVHNLAKVLDLKYSISFLQKRRPHSNWMTCMSSAIGLVDDKLGTKQIQDGFALWDGKYKVRHCASMLKGNRFFFRTNQMEKGIAIWITTYSSPFLLQILRALSHRGDPRANKSRQSLHKCPHSPAKLSKCFSTEKVQHCFCLQNWCLHLVMDT